MFTESLEDSSGLVETAEMVQSLPGPEQRFLIRSPLLSAKILVTDILELNQTFQC